MADFCRQCSLATFTEDFGDLANMCKEGEIAHALCEGCGGIIPVDHEGNCAQVWAFTFVQRQPQRDCYVKLVGTFETTRAEMIKRYGTEWGFQYKWEQFEPQIEKFGLREIE